MDLVKQQGKTKIVQAFAGVLMMLGDGEQGLDFSMLNLSILVNRWKVVDKNHSVWTNMHGLLLEETSQ